MAGTKQKSNKAKRPKKARRSMKVLSTGKTAQSNQDVYHENASTSPLLRLPPEIRNRIWLLVLGGRRVHITTNGSKGVRHMICRATVDLHEEAVGSEVPRSTQSEWFDTLYRKSHQACNLYAGNSPSPDAGNETLSLGCLQVCRQIHQEAALLPYKSNTFAFAELHYVTGFLHKVILAQARAMERLELSFERATPTVTLEKLIKSKLTGLKELRVFRERAVDYTRPLRVEREKEWEAALLQFAQLPLHTSVSIIALCQDFKHDQDKGWIWVSGPPDESTRSWAREIERQLLAAAE